MMRHMGANRALVLMLYRLTYKLNGNVLQLKARIRKVVLLPSPLVYSIEFSFCIPNHFTNLVSAYACGMLCAKNHLEVLSTFVTSNDIHCPSDGATHFKISKVIVRDGFLFHWFSHFIWFNL